MTLAIANNNYFSWYDIQTDSEKIMGYIDSFVENGFITARDKDLYCDEKLAMRGSFFSGEMEKDCIALIDCDLRLLRKIVNNRCEDNHCLCMAETRFIRNCISQELFYFEQKTADLSDYFKSIIHELEDMYELYKEWELLYYQDKMILVREAYISLKCEKKMNDLLLMPMDVENNDFFALYKEYSSQSQFASALLLYKKFALDHALKEMLPAIDQDLAKYESTLVWYHLNARHQLLECFRKQFSYANSQAMIKDLKRRLEVVKECYEKGIELNKSPRLWRQYYCTAIDAKNLAKRSEYYKVVEKFWRKISIAANEAGVLTVVEINDLLKCIRENAGPTCRSRVVHILQHAVTHHSKEADFWCQLLQCQIDIYNRKLDSVFLCFYTGLTNLTFAPIEGLGKLFEQLLSFLMTVDYENTENIFLVGILFRKDLATYLLPSYFRWLLICKGSTVIAEMLGKEYMRYASVELFQEMVIAEKQTVKFCHRSVRNCYETGLSYHGSYSNELWLDYLKFEIVYGSENNLMSVFNRAKKCLDKNYDPEPFLALHRTCSLFSNFITRDRVSADP